MATVVEVVGLTDENELVRRHDSDVPPILDGPLTISWHTAGRPNGRHAGENSGKYIVDDGCNCSREEYSRAGTDRGLEFEYRQAPTNI